MFRGCNIGGYLFAPLLEPLIMNLTDFSSVFDGKYEIVGNSVSFFPAGCKIKRVEGFNPNARIGDALADDVLLMNLTKLTAITNSFNECTISFYGGKYDATELFKYNTELVEISNSFGWIDGEGSIANLFGGYDDSVGFYPSALTTISRSFIFRSGSHDAVFDGDDMNGTLMPLGNSFFKRIAGTLKYVTGNAVGSNATYDNDSNDWERGGMSSFSGPGLLKFLSNFEASGDYSGDYPGMDDCGDDIFPYEILKGCVNLVECPNLFERVHNFKDYDAENVKENVISVDPMFKNGVSIFNDCSKLKNVSSFFRNMSDSIHIVLHGGAFKNCDLVNVDSMFRNAYIEGKIPFKLFYEEGIGEYSINGLTSAQASALGISDDEGDLSSLSDGQYSTYNGTYRYGKKTISKMENVLDGVKISESMNSYSVDNNEFEFALKDNDQYSPFEYVLEGLHYKRNENKNKYAWNKFAYDGSTDFLTRLKNSSVWQRDDIDKVNLPAEFIDTPAIDTVGWSDDTVRQYTGYNEISGSYGDRFKTKNFFCPPDIFNYCENARSTNISNALARVCGDFHKDGSYVSFRGSIGRIPEFIFEEVSEVLSVSGMFAGNENMLPDTWGSSPVSLGNLYPVGLFSHFSGLENVSGVFSETRIWKYTKVPGALFSENGGSLRDASGLWGVSTWIESGSEYSQIDTALFIGCRLLQNVSGMFGGSYSNSIVYVTPLFSYSANGLINNCSGYLSNASRAQGNVPTFWRDWPNMYGDMAFYGIIGEYSYEAMKQRFGNWEENVPINYYTNV